ncbi:MAG: transcription-repair coupling factor [Cellulosimicrobium sp.]|nr:transcription-repair coupling factor [Cellulosimicrobium sp.]
MNLTGILPALLADPAATAAVEHVRARGEADVVGPAGARPPLLAAMAGARATGPVDEPTVDAAGDRAPSGAGWAAGSRPLVVVTATGRDADELAASVRAYLPDELADVVAVLPSWETLPHERLSPRADTVARRIAVFRRLAHPDPEVGPSGPVRVLVMPVRALLQPVVDGLGELAPVELHAGSTADLTDVAERLVAAAYTRVDMVERRGEFAVRGGILDVFPPTEDHPLRVEFWGDEVSEIRWFAVADQRSLEIAEHGLWAPPCREVLLTESVRARAAALVEDLPGATEMLDKLAAGVAVEGMESLAPVLVDRMVPVLELVPDDALLVVDDAERVRRRAHDLVATTEEFLAAAWTGAVAGGKAPVDLSAASFETFSEVRAVAQRRGLGWWTLSSFALDNPDLDVAPEDGAPVAGGGTAAPGTTAAHVGESADGVPTFTIGARDVESYRGDVSRALDDVRGLQHAGWRLVLTTEGHGPAKRMVEQLGAVDTPARLVPRLDDEPEGGIVLVTPAMVGKGFVAPELRLAVFSEADLTGRAGTSTRDMRKMPSRRRNVVDPLQLKAGDFVVHEQHGVGRFVELVQRTLGTGGNAATRE